MTVSELIRRLQQLPPDLPVIVNLDLNELANSRPVRSVEPVYAQERRSVGYPTGDWTTCGWDEDEFIGPPVPVVSLRT